MALSGPATAIPSRVHQLLLVICVVFAALACRFCGVAVGIQIGMQIGIRIRVLVRSFLSKKRSVASNNTQGVRL